MLEYLLSVCQYLVEILCLLKMDILKLKELYFKIKPHTIAIKVMSYWVSDKFIHFNHSLLILELTHGVFISPDTISKFSMQSVIKISLPGLFYFNQCCLNFLLKIKFCISDTIVMFYGSVKQTLIND